MTATSDVMMWEGRPVRSACIRGFNPDGTLRYRIVPEEGEAFYVDLSKGQAVFIPPEACRSAIQPTLPKNSLPEDDALRNEFPMFDGLLAYFPNALAEVSQVSKIGNDQHNPGQPMHWARGKSTDHENKIARHLIDVGKKDARGVRHSARLAWRALALLQEELEREEGVPMSRASRRG